MRMKIISAGLVILMLVSSFFVAASSVNIENFGIGSSSVNEAELPVWYEGNFWKYEMNFDFVTREEGSITFSVEAEISDMYATVTETIVQDNEDVYVLTVDGDIEGTIFLFGSEWEIGNFEGDFGGYADIIKNTLAIKEFNFEVDGQISILNIWRDLYFTMTMTFDPSFDFFDFPLIEGEEEWDVYIEEATLDAYVDIDFPFGEHSYSSSMAFSDVMSNYGLETINVPAGVYDCFLLGGTWGYPSQLWYAPDAGYLAKVDETLDWEDGSIDTVFHLELLDTNYDASNKPPYPPSKPSGPTEGEIGEDYTYTTQTTDPQGDQIYYWFDWGDGTNSGWIGPFGSGDIAEATHRWYSKGVYSVTVKAKDESDIESDWSDPLSVMITGYPKVTLLMYYIEKKDEIEWPAGPPEWYYTCHVKSEQGGSPPQDNYNTDDGTPDGEWIESDTWTPDKEHEFLGTSRYVTIKIKLMEHDEFWSDDDLADVSGCNYPDNDGKNNDPSDKRGAMYHGTYDIVTEDLKDYDPDWQENADFVYEENGYYITSGDYEPDGSTGYENGMLDPENDALVWFRLTNDYRLPQAYAQLLEPPENRRPYEKLQFIGSVKEGAPSYSWHWDFDDGESSNEQNPIHIFEDKGTYNVELTVTDGFGQKSSYSIPVTLRNYDPILTGDQVEWTGQGSTSDTFTFSVRYTDPDYDDPSVKKVFIDGKGRTMNGQGSNSDYTLSLKGSEIGSGTHKYYFYFDDGHGGTAQTSEKTFTVKKTRSASLGRFDLLANFLDHFPFLLKLIQSKIFMRLMDL